MSRISRHASAVHSVIVDHRLYVNSEARLFPPRASTGISESPTLQNVPLYSCLRFSRRCFINAFPYRAAVAFRRVVVFNRTADSCRWSRREPTCRSPDYQRPGLRIPSQMFRADATPVRAHLPCIQLRSAIMPGTGLSRKVDQIPDSSETNPHLIHNVADYLDDVDVSLLGAAADVIIFLTTPSSSNDRMASQ